MKLLSFILGVITGVVGLNLYGIFVKPVMPSEEVEETFGSMEEIQKRFFPNSSMGKMYINTLTDQELIEEVERRRGLPRYDYEPLTGYQYNEVIIYGTTDPDDTQEEKVR